MNEDLEKRLAALEKRVAAIERVSIVKLNLGLQNATDTTKAVHGAEDKAVRLREDKSI